MMVSDPPLHREDRHLIKGWYKAAVDRATARSCYPRADHGGEGGTIKLRTAPGDKHPHFCAAVLGG